MYKLYEMAYSGHSHRVRLFLSLLGQDYESRPVSLRDGEHLTDAYKKINPFGKIPVLDDDGHLVRESNAILVYLALKHKAREWYPVDDPARAAEVQMWLNVAANDILQGPAKAWIATMFVPDETAVRDGLEASRKLLGVMDGLLDGRDWLVGDGPTIADVANYSHISKGPLIGLDLEPYLNVLRWQKNIEALPRFIAMPTPEKY
ncbi:glutathione S-transferase family protein [Emcibacter sp.]|uniref:glutathione S-transferase family protein n=1 Tax=Emcibacter sp. TaxID=1979954 RepID=UPI002AA850C7|nr:glutathione S-transferase family protein [Emcibacter sp.]